jgi:hypothetical protein
VKFTVGERIGAYVLLVVGVPTLFLFFVSWVHRVRTPEPSPYFTMAKINELTERRDISIIVPKIVNIDASYYRPAKAVV